MLKGPQASSLHLPIPMGFGFQNSDAQHRQSRFVGDVVAQMYGGKLSCGIVGLIFHHFWIITDHHNDLRYMIKSLLEKKFEISS